jgi:hypothetical protein
MPVGPGQNLSSFGITGSNFGGVNEVSSIPFYVDGIDINSLSGALDKSTLTTDTWWDSVYRLAEPKSVVDNQGRGAGLLEDVLEIDYGVERTMNTMDFDAAHFPCDIRAEYVSSTSRSWHPFIFALGSFDPGGPNTPPSGGVGPVYETIMDSSPKVIGRQKIFGEFGQGVHEGSDAWVHVSWKTIPVNVLKIRIIFTRRADGSVPVDSSGYITPYPVSVKQFKAGRSISTITDVPKTVVAQPNSDVPFSLALDPLGSSVAYSLYQDLPDNVTGSYNSGKYWKCSPQPVNFAVVNFYSDTRDLAGDGQVIDRFFLEPLTAGPNLSLYYTNDSPVSANAAAVDAALTYPAVLPYGPQPTFVNFPGSDDTHINFSKNAFAALEVDNTFLNFDVTNAWWFGLDIISTVNYTTDNPVYPDRPILCLGKGILSQDPSGFTWTEEFGRHFTIPFPAGFTINSRCKIIVSYTPPGASTPPGEGLSGVDPRLERYGVPLIGSPTNWASGTDIPPGYSMWIKSDGDAAAATYLFSPPITAVDKITLNAYPQGHPRRTLTAGGLSVVSLILKDVPLSFSQISEFYEYGTGYSATNDYPSTLPQTTDGALLRINPQFHDAQNNPVGIVGGRKTQYEFMVWTPIARDYTLREGFLYLPPTKAKFWKFEFTNLIAETTESFADTHRSVRVFPPQVVNFYNNFVSAGTWKASMGNPDTQATQNSASGSFDYTQAIAALGYVPTGNTAADMLVAADRSVQAKARDGSNSWLWDYRPWHVGQGAPSFPNTTQHIYEIVDVYHQDKLGFVVGLKQLVAYRVDYGVDADTYRYYDNFLDTTNIDLTATQGVSIGASMLQSQGNYAVIQSKTIPSTQSVRALQYASVESEPTTLLPDDFSDPVLGNHWKQYGDATATRTDDGQVSITRGSLQHYYSSYDRSPYSTVETTSYGHLESTGAVGIAGGGLSSAPVTPSNSGRIFAAANIRSTVALNAPVYIQILSGLDNSVLAQSTAVLSQSGAVLLSIDYQPGSKIINSFYSSLEGNSLISIEGTPYGSHESVPYTGSVYARVIQTGNTSDSFIISSMAIFDHPIEWSFSVDDGTTWFPAYDVRNKTQGVLTLPTVGKKLKWRVKMFKAGATVSALAIRPWYGGLLGVDTAPIRSAGPNQSTYDDVGPIRGDPMWKQWDSPLPASWVHPSPRPVKVAVTTGPPLTPS